MEIIIPAQVDKFFEGLDYELWGKVSRHLDMLSDLGKELRMPFSKRISKNLYELRILGTINVRIFYTLYNSRIILLHGFIKTTHKIPQRHLNLGQKRLKALTEYKL